MKTESPISESIFLDFIIVTRVLSFIEHSLY